MFKPRTSYADEIAATKVMLSGLKANTDKLEKWGINAEHIASYEGIFQEAMALDNDQEALKARQKEKTVALDGKLVELRKFYGDSKKMVKMKLPKESWKEFGIEDAK